MEQTFAKILTDYQHQRGSAPTDLTDPATAAELAALLAAALPAPAPAAE